MFTAETAERKLHGRLVGRVGLVRKNTKFLGDLCVLCG
jgi:hypothetical protein